ncbi:MAG: hypothetical protein ACAF42_08695 [Limnothrix sp. BL-A-16]
MSDRDLRSLVIHPDRPAGSALITTPFPLIPCNSLSFILEA